MTDSIARKTFLQPRGMEGVANPRRRFQPGQRDPLRLPADKIEIPPPPMAPMAPAPVNLLITILPPALMMIAMLISVFLSAASSNAVSLYATIPMFLMSLGIPAATLLNQGSQKKKYRLALEQREAQYRQTLNKVKQRLDGLAEEQRAMLVASYPPLAELERTVFSASKALWSRRPPDDDFLDLRVGTWEGKPSFTLEPLRHGDQNDRLPQLATSLCRHFETVPDLPALLSLQKLGSVAISGRTASVQGSARRLVLDLIIHHSPQDVELAVLGDTPEAVTNWGWLKWCAHTDALGTEPRRIRIAFENQQIDKYLEFLMSEFHARRKQKDVYGAPGKASSQAAFVVLLDDSGSIRQHGDICTLAEYGHEAHIHLIFVGGRDWPRECRSRLDLLDDTRFRLTETFSRGGEQHEGNYETASLAESERITRKLGGWEVAGSGARIPLPENIRISQMLGRESMQVETIKQAWSASYEPRDLLQFPIGVCARRDSLDHATINLLPSERGGNDAYHTILIGTTGSGKSEFMKSLVMGAAVRYPPNLLNFFFLDFKGGAAFKIFEDLPHVSGVVTNLKRELVERGLDSINNEFKRRMDEITTKAGTKDIWEYNARHPESQLPHLILFLDEFKRGLDEFPRLREILDSLVRVGRSLGMYLILANQDANSEVDKLLNNVGWRIALKVARPEELSMIDRSLPNARRAGQGYLRSLAGEITEFQAGYAGSPVQEETGGAVEEFLIYDVGVDGRYTQVYKRSSEAREEKKGKGPVVKEEEKIIATLNQATVDLNIKPASRIYLDPLPEAIPLEDVFAEAGVGYCFADEKWTAEGEVHRHVAVWGRQDIPQLCLQETLRTDFGDKDGHLWIVGAQGSGKDTALAGLLMSLALRYTPEQASFYLIELGAGELTPFEALPHTGALLKPAKENRQESERLTRLMDMLDREMEKRKDFGRDTTVERLVPPAIFVVINSFAELQKSYPDEVERMTRFVRDGGPLGIHFIIVTSRRPELIHSIANIISRRLVLQLANKDEYIDLTGRQVPPLTANIPGRAYWVDGEVSICQAAQPPANLKALLKSMRLNWKGELPRGIEVLADLIPLEEFFDKLKLKAGMVPAPVGVSYLGMAPVAPDLAEANPAWLVLGPKESGKSNFLACAALSVLKHAPKEWAVRVYALRRSNFVKWEGLDKNIQVFTSPEEIIKDAQALTTLLKESKPAADGRQLLLLIDELGVAFQPGKETLAKELNELGLVIESAADVHLMAAGLLEELRIQLSSPLVRYLRASRVGMILSRDTNEADWLGMQIGLEYRRMTIPPGRGFYINKGKLELVQTPCLRKAAASGEKA